MSRYRLIMMLVLAMPVLSGCSRSPEPVPQGRMWMDFVLALTNLHDVALLDGHRDGFVSSSDPRGGNDDFNQFERVSRRSEGWVVLFSLEGPGVIDRFWTTGMDYGHPLRIYFDDERTPRLEGPVEELFGRDLRPFVYPLAGHINQCWWSYIPLTFNRRIEVEAKAPNVHPHWGVRRLYFQANYRLLDGPVETFPLEAGQGRIPLPEPVERWWRDAIDVHASAQIPDRVVPVPPGDRVTLYAQSGPAIVREWALDVVSGDPEAGAKQQSELLQNTIIEVRYNGEEEPSFAVPLGDLFNSAWRRRKFSAFAAQSLDDGFVFRLPMPFEHSLEISVINASSNEIGVRFHAETDHKEWSPQHGYLHAVWNKSGPEHQGRPHRLANWVGRGKYMGCYVAVTARDASWWILEGDEYLKVDGHSFSGTGAEDYFNGGWYYRGASFTPVSGILDRYPFRVGQYRYRLHDAVRFEREFVMDWERGDQNVSAGWLRSVAFAYLDKPQATPSVLQRMDRHAETSPFEDYSLMLQLFELERSHDFSGAIHLIDEWLERESDHRYAGVLKLRRLEYARHVGDLVTDGDYAPFLEGAYGDDAKAQAQLLSWFYEAENRYLVGVCNNASGVVRLNDNVVLSAMHPLQLQVVGVELEHGYHTLVSDVRPNRIWPWVQMGIRGHRGIAGTGPELTRVERRERGVVERPVRNDTMRGPPHDETYMNAIPNAFILLQSSVYGVRASDWDWHKDRVQFVVEFDTQDMQFTPFSEIVHGLPPWPAAGPL